MERRGGRWVALLAGALFTVMAGDRARAAERCPEAAGRIVSIQGTVEFQPAGAADWMRAALDEALCVGDAVRVGPLSRAALALADDSVLRLDQRTTLRLRSVAPTERSLLDLLRGAISFFARRPRVLEVETPYVNAAVEGTEFLVRVADEATRIIVYEGRVRATNPQGELMLAAGDAALVPAGEAPRPEVVVRPRDAVAWSLHYPPILTALAERPPQPRPLPDALQATIAAVAANDYAAAVAALDAVPEAARDVRYQVYRAGVLLQVGRVEAAAAAIDAALARDPAAGEALAQRAVIALVRNRRDEALADARRAVELAPDSAAAEIALSYALQARFALEEARARLRDAAQRLPDDALLQARLAELELAQGDLDAAQAAAGRATELAPGLSRTQTVLGFAALARVEIDRAKAAFGRAIELDPSSPLARLGLGLARIRGGDLADGRSEIEIAAALDPNDALIRSYLGKAYFEERRGPLDRDQFEIAKELDPNDPTPWFYGAISKQLANRPVEALHDLETAIALNDNRAVYRSRLLLDQDLASRSVSLARIYDDLGFEQVAVVEAAKSLSLDPANHSAHRFLSDTYARRPRHEIAQVSELLQAQLLQPININPVQPSLAFTDLEIVAGNGPADAALNEFHPLFERNQAQLNVSGVVGNNETLGDEVVASGIWNRLSFSVGQFHFENDGFRDNNDLEHDIYNVFAQAEVDPRVSFQAEYRHRKTDGGDLDFNFDPDSFDPAERQDITQDTARLGARLSPGPGSDVLVSVIYGDREQEQQLFFPGLAIANQNEEKGYQVEAQYLTHGQPLNFAAGFAVNDIDFESESTFDFGALGCLLPSCEVTTDEDSDQRTAYVYGNLTLPESVVWTLGVSVDDLDEEEFDVQRLNPKAGVQWQITDGLRLRAAAFRTVKRSLIADQTIEPTTIAGFNQFFDNGVGAKTSRYAAALDARLAKGLYAGIEGALGDIDVPVVTVGGGSQTEDQDEKSLRGYVYLTPHPWWAFTVEYVFDDFRRQQRTDPLLPTDVETMEIPVGVRFFHPSGLFAQLDVTYVDQQVERPDGSPLADGGSDFVVVDTAVGVRLPQHRGIVSLEVRNLFDEDFKFQDDNFRTPQINNPRHIPERTILLRGTFTF